MPEHKGHGHGERNGTSHGGLGAEAISVFLCSYYFLIIFLFFWGGGGGGGVGFPAEGFGFGI